MNAYIKSEYKNVGDELSAHYDFRLLDDINPSQRGIEHTPKREGNSQ